MSITTTLAACSNQQAASRAKEDFDISIFGDKSETPPEIWLWHLHIPLRQLQCEYVADLLGAEWRSPWRLCTDLLKTMQGEIRIVLVAAFSD